MFQTRPLAILMAVIGFIFLLSGVAVMVSSQDTQVDATVPATEAIVPTSVNLTPLPSSISGFVKNTDGEVLAGATIQLQATPNMTQSAEDGSFTLTGISGTSPTVVIAWYPGHFVGWQDIDPSAPDWTGGNNIVITLRSLPTTDNNDYDWFEFEGVRGSAACGLCHREYSEWQADAHSQSANNMRFMSIYTGSNANGDPGQIVQRDANGVPLPPNPDEPYYGPGYRLDNYNRTGNCATCHTPLASKAPNNQNCSWSGCHTDLTVERSNGVIPQAAYPMSPKAKDGVSCELCHKIGEVFIDPKTNLPYPDMPGILSYRLYRPADDSQQVFFGTLIDVARRDTYMPLETKSEFCAGCHYGVFGGVVGMQMVTDGTVIYNSYGEWQASPYADPETGQTCQDCHMPVSGSHWFVTPERGGLIRDYAPLHDHTMRGITDLDFMQNAVTMTTNSDLVDDQLRLEVSITNDQTGHDIPTGVPIRSMILVVEAVDEDGNSLNLVEGPVNPDYSGNYAGVPGKTFAKVVRDEWTGEAPTAAFWRDVSIAEDTRLVALATDTTKYSFAVQEGKSVTVHVRLLFRRAFYKLAQQKGWNDPDVLMEEETIQVPVK